MKFQVRNSFNDRRCIEFLFTDGNGTEIEYPNGGGKIGKLGSKKNTNLFHVEKNKKLIIELSSEPDENDGAFYIQYRTASYKKLKISIIELSNKPWNMELKFSQDSNPNDLCLLTIGDDNQLPG